MEKREVQNEQMLLRFVAERCEDIEIADMLDQVWSASEKLNEYLHKAMQRIIQSADPQDIEMAVLNGKGLSEKEIALTMRDVSEKYVALRLDRLYAKMIVSYKELLYGELPYPFNVIVQIFSLTPLETQTYVQGYMSEKTDIRATTNYILSCLQERDEQILIMRYRDDTPYHVIASRLGITTERVRQIKNRIFRKLPKMFTKNIILYGLRNYYKTTMEEEHSQMISLAETLADNRVHEITCVALDEEKRKKLQYEQTNAIFLKMTIDEFAIRYHLSPRASNCLRRHCIGTDIKTGQRKYCATIMDVVNMTEKQLREVRNLGTKSYGEIVSALNKVGLTLRVCEQGYDE